MILCAFANLNKQVLGKRNDIQFGSYNNQRNIQNNRKILYEIVDRYNV